VVAVSLYELLIFRYKKVKVFPYLVVSISIVNSGKLLINLKVSTKMLKFPDLLMLF
jgi:hypothetical protein